MSTATEPLQRSAGVRRAGLIIVIVAVVAIAAAFVVGLSGLLGNPVKSTDQSGVSELAGSFDPFTGGTADSGCPSCAAGYIRDGGRSVFVVFPAGCSAPASGTHVTVSGRLDTALGKGSYRALACATAGQ